MEGLITSRGGLPAAHRDQNSHVVFVCIGFIYHMYASMLILIRAWIHLPCFWLSPLPFTALHLLPQPPHSPPLHTPPISYITKISFHTWPPCHLLRESSIGHSAQSPSLISGALSVHMRWAEVMVLAPWLWRHQHDELSACCLGRTGYLKPIQSHLQKAAIGPYSIVITMSQNCWQKCVLCHLTICW